MVPNNCLMVEAMSTNSSAKVVSSQMSRYQIQMFQEAPSRTPIRAEEVESMRLLLVASEVTVAKSIAALMELEGEDIDPSDVALLAAEPKED